MSKKIPVLLITGFLGAGKTTLLNHLLTQLSDEKVAVLVNEFGEVGIDDKLLLRTDEEILEMNNGAICCAVRNDTVKVLLRLTERKDLVFDRVIIETTGLANPVPLARLFLDKPMLAEKYSIEAIVTLVDASQVVRQLRDTPEVKTQIATADVVLLNKIDLVDERALAVAKHSIRRVNPLAVIHETTRSELTLETLVEASREQVFLNAHTHEDDHHDHDDGVESFVLTADTPLDLEKVGRWIGEFILLNSEKLMRYKGFLDIKGMEERFVFQGVHEHFENRRDREWGDQERVSQVVVIGKDLDRDAFETSFGDLVADA